MNFPPCDLAVFATRVGLYHFDFLKNCAGLNSRAVRRKLLVWICAEFAVIAASAGKKFKRISQAFASIKVVPSGGNSPEDARRERWQ
jgi:hypothetical protein